MAKDKPEEVDIQILQSRAAALEQLIEVYENSVVEQADKLYLEIAERRRAEEETKELLLQNRAILESAGEGIYGLDLEGKTTFANPASARMIGYQPEELLGKFQHAILHHTRPDGTPYPREECPIYLTFKTGTASHVDDELFWKKDGTSFPVEYASTPMWKNGKLTGAVVVFKDITDRRLAEENVQRLKKELEVKVEERTRQLTEAQEELLRREKLNLLGMIAGNVGNELRNPLGVMSNAVFFLESQLADADESVKEYLGIIRKEIDGSRRVLSDFIDYFHARAPRLKEVPVDELIKQSLAGCGLPENIMVSLSFPENLPAVTVDPSQMKQVFQNLITNAVQALPEGGELRISAIRVGNGAPGGSPVSDDKGGAPRREDADSVEVSISDSGAGISPEHMGKVFQPLFTTKARGIGLGLPICQGFVEAIGGRIVVSNNPMQGATFKVLLPVQWGERE